MLRKLLSPKLIISSFVILVVVVGAAAAYVAVVAGVNIPGLEGAFRVEVEPPSPEALARAVQVEADIREAIVDKSAFYLTLTDENLTDLLVANNDVESRIHKLNVEIRPEDVQISGELAGRVPVGFSGNLALLLDRGEVQLDLKKVNLSSLPTPGFVKDEIQPFIDDVIDINEQLRESGATRIQAITQIDGQLTIVGVQAAGATVADSTMASLRDASQSTGGSSTIVAPGADIVPPGRTGSASGSTVYLALGDSLAANVGVSDPRDGYVSRFHQFLESKRGTELGLINLGVSGESSISIHESQLPQALATLASEQVDVLTIDLGANDLIAHLGSDACQQGIRSDECVQRIDSALQAFEANFGGILSDLRNALPSDAEFYVMTAYNPFDFGFGLPFEEYSSGVIADLNTLIAAEAANVGATLADPFDAMADHAGAWTNMLDNADIHPNADGYQVLALSLAEAAG